MRSVLKPRILELGLAFGTFALVRYLHPIVQFLHLSNHH